jgi:hypothetical protein
LENNLLFPQFDIVLPVPAPSTCCGSCC